MIPIQRDSEPDSLPPIRAAELARLRQIVAQQPPSAEDFGSRFTLVRDELWKRQHYKCCYCEAQEQRRRNDVEHFRPKTRANRGEGFPQEGYWWLAWTWENLFFACRNCNQSAKRDQFPLEPGSPVLKAEEMPPGAERALLVDPARENPIDHIQFRRLPSSHGKWKWIPVARAGSIKGSHTIRVLKLDRQDLVDLYTRHIENTVHPEVAQVLESETAEAPRVQRSWSYLQERLLAPQCRFVGLSYDALHELVPEPFRVKWSLVIRKP